LIRSQDEVLVERARAGDVAAFETLISQYERKVYNLAYRLTGNHEDASDMAQEAFIRVFQKLPEFRGDSSFSTWLFRIASNACLDEIRKRKRHRTVSLDNPYETDEGEMSRQYADAADGPEEIIDRQETQAMVQACINALDEEYRVVVVLRDIKGYAYNEIAEMLGLNLGTVKSRLNRARAAIKEKFTRLELLPPSDVYRHRRGKTNEM
jgi:RNA polymerase sigma-70 factor (ECF subfamily)